MPARTAAIPRGGEVRDPKALLEWPEGSPAKAGRGFRHRCARPSCRKHFSELFAGTRRLATAVGRAGVQAESYEIDDDIAEDMFSPAVEASLFHRARVGQLHAAWSRARRGRPPPLRGDTAGSIWGLPHLSAKDQARVRLGNKSAKWAARFYFFCASRGIA